MTVTEQGAATATIPGDRGDGRGPIVPATGDIPPESPKQMMNRLQGDTGMKLRDLLVMDPKNDPFNCGTPTDTAQAEFLVALAARHPSQSTHLRRLHYRAIDDDQAVRHDGRGYWNTQPCWNYMNQAATAARHLSMIPNRKIHDARSRPWHFATTAIPPEVSLQGGYVDMMVLSTDLRLTRPRVDGYRHEVADDVRVALVVEKSTVNDVLAPLCNQLDIDFLAANGYVTHTRIHDWLHADLDRPARLLFLSDFDPAGAKMPQAFARELEFLIRRDRLVVDFAVEQIGLTRDQVIEYELPRIPLSTKDDVDPRLRGKRLKFLDAHDIDGAVELDALVARHPGELQRLIRDAVTDLRDATYPDRVRQARSTAAALVADVWDQHAAEIDELVDAVQQQLDDANAAHADAVERIRQGAAMTRLKDCMDAVRRDLDDIGIPAHPVPIRDDHEQSWMMRSDRDYLEQLDAYRRGGGA